VGVCEAVEELGLADTIQVVGFDAYDGAMARLGSGVLDGVIVQNPYNMGYLGVRYAVKCLNQEQITHIVDTGVTLVTKSNMNDEDVQWLLSN
ncbi:MAG TPA: ABC transporter substrate-binding protein, partial [Ruminococcus sp.]|nr:ABC transporter substrate-binding protein [Ruminococcus sp.]